MIDFNVLKVLKKNNKNARILYPNEPHSRAKVKQRYF